MKSSIDSKDDGRFIPNSPSFDVSLIDKVKKLEIHGSNQDLSSLASSSNTSKPEGDSDEKWHCQVKSQIESILMEVYLNFLTLRLAPTKISQKTQNA